MATYELGRNKPVDAAIMLICREFNVNEAWLRTGSGEMFRETSHDDEIAAFVGDVLRDEPDAFRKRFVSMLSRLEPSDWAALEEKARELVGVAAEPADQQAIWEREADEFAAMAREQYLSEKLRESQASSANGSGNPGGVA